MVGASSRTRARAPWRSKARNRQNVGAAVFLYAVSLNWSASAQIASPSPPPAGATPTAPVQAPASPPQNEPGFLDAVGRWFGDSKAKIDQSLKDTQEAIGELGARATDAAKSTAGMTQQAIGSAQQATDALIALPGARVVTGRERCALAANGAPDCAAAATVLCRGKGFASGRGLDVNSRQKCPAWVWLSGQPPAPGQCKTETFVLRAVCQ